MPADQTLPSLILRPLQASDIDDLARIMAETPLWQRYNVSHEKAALRLQGGLAQNASIIVADRAGSAVGFVWFVDKGAFNRSGYIMLIAVDEKLRGHGIGQALMAEAEAQLFATNNDIFLLVSDFNLAAQNFYRQRGYQQVGALPNYVTEGISELIFRKQKG